jgi:hypothetical protein
MMNEAGPELDRQIERKLNGDAKKKTPPYSTSEKAANRLLRRLELQDMPCSIEEIDGVWYCTFWIAFSDRRERLSTGSGETRALAIARAVMNARLGMGGRLSPSDGVARLHWSHVASAPTGAEPLCAGCGVALPSRNREASNRFCPVCSWRAGKSLLAASEGARKASRIPVSAATEEEESPAEKIAEG